MDEGVDDRAVVAAVTSVGSESTRRGIGDERSRDNTDLATEETHEHLEDGLELGVIEGILGRIGVDTEGVDTGLVTRVQSSCRVGGVSDVRVDGVGHLVAELQLMIVRDILDQGLLSCCAYHRELVHGHLRQITTVLCLVGDQAGSGDHVGGHAVTDVQKNVLGLTDLGQFLDGPVGGGVGAVVAEDGLVLTGLEESNTAVGLGGDVDEGRSVGILGEKVLVPER